MKIENKIMAELQAECRVTAKLFIDNPSNYYFKGLHEQAIGALRAVSNIIEFHQEEEC